MNENVSAEQLRLFMERLETLEGEKRDLGGDIKDVYSEAKGTGFDVKTMKALLKLRGMDPSARQESDALLETYRLALGMGDDGEFHGLQNRRNAQDERLQAEILATLRTTGRATIVALKGAVKDKATKALTYDQITVHLGNMIARGEVTSGPGRLADFPEYWAI